MVVGAAAAVVAGAVAMAAPMAAVVAAAVMVVDVLAAVVAVVPVVAVLVLCCCHYLVLAVEAAALVARSTSRCNTDTACTGSNTDSSLHRCFTVPDAPRRHSPRAMPAWRLRRGLQSSVDRGYENMVEVKGLGFRV